jgi:methylphosphotriester-DNA--protein-cysteine methyltransferase
VRDVRDRSDTDEHDNALAAGWRRCQTAKSQTVQQRLRQYTIQHTQPRYPTSNTRPTLRSPGATMLASTDESLLSRRVIIVTYTHTNTSKRSLHAYRAKLANASSAVTYRALTVAFKSPN